MLRGGVAARETPDAHRAHQIAFPTSDIHAVLVIRPIAEIRRTSDSAVESSHVQEVVWVARIQATDRDVVVP